MEIHPTRLLVIVKFFLRVHNVMKNVIHNIYSRVFRIADLTQKTFSVFLWYPFILFARPHRIKRSIKIFFHYGLRAMFQDAYDILSFEKEQRARLSFDPLFLRVVMPPMEKSIHFPTYSDPLVSIVICCNNQWDSTLLCLNALRVHTNDIPYELIIVDDGSSDETEIELSRIQNITVIRHEKSLGYLLSANEGASHARGVYLIQLNNDTVPQPGWLAPLITILEQRKDAVISGPMFLWPNGSIQEAGGRIFSDGRTAQYGNGGTRFTSEYRYSRPVDYISGAALCIRKSFWDLVGGYDVRFFPAYYEDADLALTAISQGYHVLYQPQSKVVHWSNTSYGAEGLSRIESLTRQRRDLFVEKWKRILPSFSTTNQLRTMGVENQRKAPIILVVDHRMPHPEEDAGSRCTYQYLTLLTSLGCIVKFVPWKYGCQDILDTSLASLDVEVLHPLSLPVWIKLHGHSVHTILFFRSVVMSDLAPRLRPYTNAKFILCVADVESLRTHRTLESSRDLYAQVLSNEEEAFLFAQGIATHSSFEQKYICARVPASLPVSVIPNHIISTSASHPLPEVASGDSILFVGGFLHQPNCDALVWLREEIIPCIRRLLPSTRIVIAGSFIPLFATKEIDTVEFVHHPSDTELADLYKNARVSLAPLRFGAGAKVKVVESLSFGVPVVATPIAAEGFPEPLPCLIGEDAESIASLVYSVYTDEHLFKRYSMEGLQYIKDFFSPSIALMALSHLIPDLTGKESLLPAVPASFTTQSIVPQRMGPLFSIVIPVWRPETRHLREALNSVFWQTYSNWELCLACSEVSEEAQDVITMAVRRNPRVTAVMLEKNLGISGNTNEAIKNVRGDYIAFMDQDDLLAPHALEEYARILRTQEADILYSDEIVSSDDGGTVRHVVQKPGWSPEMLRSINYISHLTVVRTTIVRRVGGLSSECDGAQDHDFLLRIRPLCSHIVHIPLPLYLWRAHPNSTAFAIGTKPYALQNILRAVKADIARSGETAKVSLHSETSCRVDIRYAISREPRVDIVIASRDAGLLTTCLESLFKRTRYQNYSVSVVNHNGTSAIQRYLSKYYPDTVREVAYNGIFNFSTMANRGAQSGDGELILFLNDDTIITDAEWLHALVEQGLRPHVGAVGAKLWYPDGRIQHFGVLMGLGPTIVAHNAYRGTPPRLAEDLYTTQITREFLAVTGACLLTKRDLWSRINGFNEQLSVAFNDVDYCLRLYECKYSILATPYANLIHHESASRPMGVPKEDSAYMRKHWRKYIAHDPFLSPDATSFTCFSDADNDR